MKLDDYLARIEYLGPVAPTLACLTDTTLTTATDTTTTTRGYDHLGQLAHLDTTGDTVTTTSFEWDPSRRAEQLTTITTDGATIGVVRGLGNWTASRTGGTHTGIGSDISASVVPTTATPALAASDNYDPYGNTTTPTDGVTLGYRGELTINHQTHLRNRDYQPVLGQFTSTDPIPGRLGTTTLNNTYTYANNNPLHNIDPLGLSATNDKPIGDSTIDGMAIPQVPVPTVAPTTGTTTTTTPTTTPSSPATGSGSGAGLGPAPGDDYQVLCGPPSGPATSQTPGSCEWTRDLGGCDAVCIVQNVGTGLAGLGQAAAGLAVDIARCSGGDPVGTVNCVARILHRSGGVGDTYRNSVNSFVSVAARAAAIAQAGRCDAGPRGLQVCLVPEDASITVRVTATGGVVDIPLYSKGGTTIGNVFITDDVLAPGRSNLLEHELFHTFQWAAAGGLPFAVLYGLEFARAGECNRFEEAADFAKGDYPQCVGR